MNAIFGGASCQRLGHEDFFVRPIDIPEMKSQKLTAPESAKRPQVIIIFGQVAQPSQAFQAFKDQLDLLAQSVPVQHLADWKLRCRPSCKN